MKNILVVGGGGREHAIIMKLAESKHVGKLYFTPGNGGISKYAECFNVSATDIDGVCYSLHIQSSKDNAEQFYSDIQPILESIKIG